MTTKHMHKHKKTAASFGGKTLFY